MSDPDIRWLQRLANFRKALAQLAGAVELGRSHALSDIERQGLIKAFEFTYELAWNVMKDYFEYQGGSLVTGSRDAIREAFARALVADGEGWMAMVQDRNKAAHTYNESVAREIAERVSSLYHPLFAAFAARMDELAEKAHDGR
jgi:nucleotidyltransferase substrate binding protein (TIGR01987 family)